MKDINTKEKIVTFNIFRIVLAFLIFLFHLRINYGFSIPQVKGLNTFLGISNILMVGFFMLSGFVLYYNYHNKGLENPKQLKNFYLKRLVSTYPLYWIILIYIVITKLSFFDTTSKNILAIPIEILGLQTFFSEITGNFGNSGTWFVSTILILYLIFPGLYYLLNHISQKYIIPLLVFLYLGSVYITIFQAYFNTYVYANPIFRIPEFLIGMLLALLFLDNYKKKLYAKHIGLQIIIAIIIYYIGVNILYNLTFFNKMIFNYSPTYFNFLSIPFFSFVIYKLAFLNNKVVLRISNLKIVNYLSNLSYSFYLVQIITFVEVAKIVNNNNFGLTYNTNTLLFIVTFLFNLVLSIIVHEVIEKPCNKYFRSRFNI